MNWNELQTLCLLNGTSGRESAVRNYLLDAIAAMHLPADAVCVDGLGNVIVRKKGLCSSVPTIMLCAHMDEVALMVTEICADGSLRFGAVGGVDAAAVIGRQVLVGKQGIPGVIGSCPVHRLSPDARKQPAQMSALYVDIGAKDREDALALTAPGDVISFAPVYQEFGNGKIAAKALDDRFGCALLLSLLRKELPCDVTVVFSVQEEVGLRGAAVAANAIQPAIGLILETTTAADLPGSENPVCRLGGGAVISFMDGRTVYDADLYQMAAAICDREQIPWQTKTKIAGGNDAGAIQNSGARVLAVSIPCRYLHSPLCVMQHSDGVACEQLIDHLLAALAKEYGT
ncbi:MAG: M42 family peptidase [Oscillospiraceae bacterium]|nr:M42 family peptidase [Oscillospiraceae bacterium]